MSQECENSLKKWLEFVFVLGCPLDDSQQNDLKTHAAESPDGACCPFALCMQVREKQAICPHETSEACRKKCDAFYKKNVKGGKK